MELLFIILLFAAIFAIYDMIRTTNKNVLKQDKEIKKIREELARFIEK